MSAAGGWRRAVKRAVDVALSSLLLLVALPLMILVAGMIKASSPGPVLFRQTREGRHGRRFVLLKFRTMRVDAEAVLAELLSHDDRARVEWRQYRRLARDPRVIPVLGRALRKSSLDELPQLLNVIAGDMSLIGPRPVELEVAEGLDPGYREIRQSVRPGLTGLWQVSGRSDTDLSGLEVLDVEYVKNWSLWLDVTILARTPRAVLSARGAY